MYQLYHWHCIPVMAAIAVRKKVVSIGHSPPSFCFQSLQSFLFVKLNQEQLYVLNALKIREKLNWAKWARWAQILKITHPDDQLCSLTCSSICMLRHVSKHLSIPFKIRKKTELNELSELEYWKNILTDEQLCSLTRFLVFARSDKYQNIYSFFQFKIRKKLS